MKDLRVHGISNLNKEELTADYTLLRNVKKGVDPLIKEGEDVLINIQWCNPEGIEGKVIVSEIGRRGRGHMIIFQTKNHRPNEYDILEFDSFWGCWESHCIDTEYAHKKKAFLRDCTEELMYDGYSKILKFLWDENVNIQSCCNYRRLSWEYSLEDLILRDSKTHENIKVW